MVCAQSVCGAGGAGRAGEGAVPSPVSGAFQLTYPVLAPSERGLDALPRVRPAAPGALAELCRGCSPTAAPEPRTAARNSRQNTPNRQAQLLTVSVCLWLQVLVACCGLFLISFIFTCGPCLARYKWGMGWLFYPVIWISYMRVRAAVSYQHDKQQ